MTRKSVREYVGAIRERYRRGTKEEKGKVLDEFTQTTGMHRKAAIRRLNRGSGIGGRRRPGRPREYGPAVVEALKTIWEAADRLCSKRLRPFVPELIRVLNSHGEAHITLDIQKQLCEMSAATIDRLSRPWRRVGGRRSLSTTRAGSLLKNAIPIRTFADWQENKPGFLEIDLVAHCGESVDGFYLNTLCAVDVHTGWCECQPVWGKGQVRVRGAVHRIRQRLPFPLRGVDSDNGGEFINHYFYNYCHEEKITFTRSRSYKKNDSCHVEQKNGNVVRRLVGYDRYASHAAFECLQRLYYCARLYVNLFQPTMKLWSKTRHGARVHKVYEPAQTPYQRVLQSGVLTAAQLAELSFTYEHTNPVQLLRQLNGNLEQLWRPADKPQKPVTAIMRQQGGSR